MESKIRVTKINDEITVETELDSGLLYIIDMIVHAKEVKDILPYQPIGYTPFDPNRYWELKKIEVLRCDVYCEDFDCFATLPQSAHELIASKLENLIEVHAEFPEPDYEDHDY